MSSTLAWPPPPVSDRYSIVEFRAMASPCRIVTDTDDLARAGEHLVHELERRWSRFIPTSEVSVVNAAAGDLVLVSAYTAELFSRAEFARTATGGAFDPLILDRIESLGYGPDTPAAHAPSAGLVPPRHEPIEVFDDVHGIRLPNGSRFDPGGIGKGLAGDLVLDLLRSLGARSAQIELGGDVRLGGVGWTGAPWRVDVQDPRDRSTVMSRVELAEGAIATSSVLGHTWSVGGRDLHHLIDPTTGEPSDTDVLSVTATSSELWWAEVVAKVAVLAGSRRAPDVMRKYGCSGIVLDRQGAIVPVTAESREDAL